MDDMHNGHRSETYPPDPDASQDGFDAQAMRDEAERQLNDAAEQAKEKLGELQDGIEDFIREKPVQTLLVAAGVGLLVGTLLKR